MEGGGVGSERWGERAGKCDAQMRWAVHGTIRRSAETSTSVRRMWVLELRGLWEYSGTYLRAVTTGGTARAYTN